MIKQLVSALAFCAIGLATKESLAWFQVCNHLPDGLWVSYSHYVPNTSKINDECGAWGRSGGCYLSAWRTRGWWRIEPNQCATVMGVDITNRYSYLYVESDSGGTLTNANTPFYVRDPAYTWEEYSQEHYTSGMCIGSTSTYDFCTPAGYWVNFKQIDTGSYKDYTVNIN